MNEDIENFDTLYKSNPVTVKITCDGETVTIHCDGEQISANVDSKLIWNIASMLALHADTRLANVFDDSNGQHHVDVLKIDFNSIAYQSDVKWEVI